MKFLKAHTITQRIWRDPGIQSFSIYTVARHPIWCGRVRTFTRWMTFRLVDFTMRVCKKNERVRRCRAEMHPIANIATLVWLCATPEAVSLRGADRKCNVVCGIAKQNTAIKRALTQDYDYREYRDDREDHEKFENCYTP
jgi:hypothetical protein